MERMYSFNKKNLLTILFIFLPTLLISPLAPATGLTTCEYWVAPAPVGNNKNPGTNDRPWATMKYASNKVPDRGCTVWFKDGIYNGQNRLSRRFSTPTTFKAVTPYKAVMQFNGTVVALNGARNLVFEGFEFRHSSEKSSPVVFAMTSKDANTWSEDIVVRNNIFHDSYNNDLLKLWNGVRNAVIEKNIFYNQGLGDSHMDINSVSDVVIQDNILFNDYAGSGRPVPDTTRQFIIIKDSGENRDSMKGSRRVTVRRNVFLNWEGGQARFIKVGNDGKPYFEGREIRVENNLFIGNSQSVMDSAFGVSGGKDIYYVNNTIVGDLPTTEAYAFWLHIKESNPKNQYIHFYNNIWSDPTGTMETSVNGKTAQFDKGNPNETQYLSLDNNLYWNGGKDIPFGSLINPHVIDKNSLVADPKLNSDQKRIILPRWTGDGFLSGNETIRDEFIRLVEMYGSIPIGSPAIGKADPQLAPKDDILGLPRTNPPDLGAFEYRSPSGGN